MALPFCLPEMYTAGQLSPVPDIAELQSSWDPLIFL